MTGHLKRAPAAVALCEGTAAGANQHRVGAREGKPAAGPAPDHRPEGDRLEPRVIGLDLSLTSTGIADARGDGASGIALRTIQTQPARALRASWERLGNIHGEIWRTITGDRDPALVLIEGPSYASGGAGTWDRAGLWWKVVDRLLADEYPVAIVAPTALKKYALGKGNGKGVTKAAVASAAGARYGRVFATDDEADAFVLTAMGLDHLGCPVAQVPKAHREALAKVAWPEVPR